MLLYCSDCNLLFITQRMQKLFISGEPIDVMGTDSDGSRFIFHDPKKMLWPRHLDFGDGKTFEALRPQARIPPS